MCQPLALARVVRSVPRGMHLRTTRRKNADGSTVDYYQLAENTWDPKKAGAVAKVVYNFGRADQMDGVARGAAHGSLSMLEQELGRRPEHVVTRPPTVGMIWSVRHERSAASVSCVWLPPRDRWSGSRECWGTARRDMKPARGRIVAEKAYGPETTILSNTLNSLPGNRKGRCRQPINLHASCGRLVALEGGCSRTNRNQLRPKRAAKALFPFRRGDREMNSTSPTNEPRAMDCHSVALCPSPRRTGGTLDCEDGR
jgi:hypothetical protein